MGLVSYMNKEKKGISFAVHCGNLVNAWPGQPERAQQISDFKKIIEKIDKSVPLLVVPGEHDIGQEPTRATVADWKSQFGDDYFELWKGQVRFLCLNVVQVADKR